MFDVQADEALGGGSVARGHRRENVAVLATGFALADHGFPREPQVALHLRAQLHDQFERHRRTGRLEQLVVEARVGRHPGGVVGDRVHAVAVGLQLHEVLVADARHDFFDQVRFEQRANLEGLLNALRADGGDHRAPVRHGGDPAFRFEQPQRLAHRHARGAELLGQRNLVEFGAVGDAAGLNRAAQGIGDEAGRRLPRASGLHAVRPRVPRRAS